MKCTWFSLHTHRRCTWNVLDTMCFYFVSLLCSSFGFWEIADSFVIQLSLSNNTTTNSHVSLFYFFVIFWYFTIIFCFCNPFASIFVLMHDWPLTTKVHLEPLVTKDKGTWLFHLKNLQLGTSLCVSRTAL